MRRTKEEAEQTRQQIFEAGLRVFSEKGFAAATMSDVAREAGFTRGAIYWHFNNKEAFFHEICSRLSSHYDSLINEVIEEDVPFLELTRRTVIRLLKRFNEDGSWRAMQELVIRTSLSNNEMPLRPEDANRDHRAREFLRQAVAGGEIYSGWDPETAFIAISSVLSGVFLQSIDKEVSLDDRQIEAIADFVVRGIAPTEE